MKPPRRRPHHGPWWCLACLGCGATPAAGFARVGVLPADTVSVCLEDTVEGPELVFLVPPCICPAGTACPTTTTEDGTLELLPRIEDPGCDACTSGTVRCSLPLPAPGATLRVSVWGHPALVLEAAGTAWGPADACWAAPRGFDPVRVGPVEVASDPPPVEPDPPPVEPDPPPVEPDPPPDDVVTGRTFRGGGPPVPSPPRRGSEVSVFDGVDYPPEPPGEGIRVVRVTDVAGLVAAVASDTRIVLAAGDYHLETLWDSVEPSIHRDTRDAVPPPGGPHVRWNNPYDGWEIEIHDVRNLEIVGEGPVPPRLFTSPRGSFVLRFRDARGVRLENLVVGHTTPGFCLGGVLGFDDSRDIRVRHVDLFGSGTVGVRLERVRDARFEEVVIRECTYRIVEVEDARGVVFADSVFHDNGEFEQVLAGGRSEIRFDACTFERNRVRTDDPFIAAEGRSAVTVANGILRGNRYRVRSSPAGVEWIDCTVEDESE